MRPRTLDMVNARRQGREGVALLVALLFIVLLTVLVVEFCYEASVDASLVESGETDADAYIAARSAVASALALLAADVRDTTTTGGTSQSNSAQFDSEQDVWFTRREDSLPAHQEINDSVMMWNVDDEYGKLNLSALIVKQNDDAASENEFLIEALRQFLLARGQALGIEGDPTDAILDWIDGPNNGDDNEETRTEGAESDYYESLEVPYACKNGPMDSIEELLLVKGMTPDMYFGDPEIKDSDGTPMRPVSEYLTVRGNRRGRVNINTAPREVLAAVAEAATKVGGQAVDAGAIITARTSQPFQDEKSITDQNMMITDAPRQQASGDAGGGGDNGSPPRGIGRGSTGTPTAAGTGRSMFVVASRVFRIQGDGFSGDTQVRIEAFVRRNAQVQNTGQTTATTTQNQLFEILDWRVIR